MRLFLRFILVGGSGVLVNLGVFALLVHLGVNRYLASPIAIELSILWNFFLHDRWTFRARRPRGRSYQRGLWFNLASLGTLAISYGSFVVFSLVWPALPPIAHQLLAIPPATLLNFFVNSAWIFRSVPGRGRSQ